MCAGPCACRCACACKCTPQVRPLRGFEAFVRGFTQSIVGTLARNFRVHLAEPGATIMLPGQVAIARASSVGRLVARVAGARAAAPGAEEDTEGWVTEGWTEGELERTA